MAAATKFCQTDMTALLVGGNDSNGATYTGPQVAATFPNALVVITSYFPILSSGSTGQLVELALMLTALGFVAGGPWGVLSGALTPAVAAQMVANCQAFNTTATASLRAAAAAANAKLPSPRVFVAVAPYQDSNALFGSQAWLWGLNVLSPMDPMAPVRAPLCRAAFPGASNSVMETVCEHASIGHPNQAGAQQFANAVIPLVNGQPCTFSGQAMLSIGGGGPTVPFSCTLVFTNDVTSVQVGGSGSDQVAINGGQSFNVTASGQNASVVVTASGAGSGGFVAATGAITGLPLSAKITVSPQVTGALTEDSTLSVTLATTGTGGSPLNTSTGAIVLVGTGTAQSNYLNGQQVSVTLSGKLSPVPRA
jgi:hypothetical protein